MELNKYDISNFFEAKNHSVIHIHGRLVASENENTWFTVCRKGVKEYFEPCERVFKFVEFSPVNAFNCVITHISFEAQPSSSNALVQLRLKRQGSQDLPREDYSHLIACLSDNVVPG